MANWAKYMEDTVGKRVSKRAKNSIHFDNGNNTTTAYFTGKPSHYFSNGVWKPIDTKLLLGNDGHYGCAHSNVKIHPNGRVKLDNSDYGQFTELPGAPDGVVDDDKLVREFNGGRQYLYITETGFRQEIVLDRKPNLKLKDIKKLLAVEYGNLPLKYVATQLTAIDSSDVDYPSVFVYDGDVSKAIAWFESATYPVTIDPDFSVTSEAGDTRIMLNDGNNYGATTPIGIGRFYTNDNVQRGLFKFDMSSITGVATNATIKITTNNLHVFQYTYVDFYGITSANGDWIPGTKNGTAAGTGEPNWSYKAYPSTTWAGSAGLSTPGTDYVNTVVATIATPAINTAVTVSISTTLINDWIAGNNYGLLAKARSEIGSNQGFMYHTSEHATVAMRPTLSVTYTAGTTYDVASVISASSYLGTITE